MIADTDGTAAVRLARSVVARAIGAAYRAPGAELGPVFDEPRGVFVTWKVAATHELRGCIGYPLPIFPLREATERAAVAAAVDDPRFPPVLAPELPDLLAEVSILTVPAPLPNDRLPSALVVGRDGLLVARGRSSGLLLPQVAVEQGWTAEEFLDGACAKAGLPSGAWRRPDVRVQSFRAEVFAETRPEGPVTRTASVDRSR